jgi:alcohol dehydrogenase (NADP+)
MAQAGYRQIDCARSYGNEKEVRVQRHSASCHTHTAEKFKGLAHCFFSILLPFQVGLSLKKLFQNGVVKREDLFITSKLWLGSTIYIRNHSFLQSYVAKLQKEGVI